MQIALLSDTHIGFRFGHRLCAAGYNQREADFEQALVNTIDGIIAMRPRLIIHGGDSFHHFNPTDRSRTFFIRQQKRLYAALPNVAQILLRGNHDTSRLLRDGSALATTAESLPEPVFGQPRADLPEGTLVLESGLLVIDGFAPVNVLVDDVLVQAVAWARNDGELKQAIDAAGKLERPAGVTHMLLVLHAGLSELPEFERMTPGSQTLSLSELPTNFDHIFSGHFHGHWQRPIERFSFIGSTERTSANQLGQAKGWLSYDTTTGLTERHLIEVRAYYDLGDVTVAGLDGKAIEAKLAELLLPLGDLSQAMVRLRLIDIARDVYATLDRAAIAASTGRALHFDLRYQPADLTRSELVADSNLALREIDVEWHDFASGALAERSPEERALIMDIGRRALAGELLASAAA